MELNENKENCSKIAVCIDIEQGSSSMIYEQVWFFKND